MAPTSAFATRVTSPATARRRVASEAVVASQYGVRRAQGGVARQIKDQRRAYARAVLRGLARTYQGRPAAGVATILRQALVPLGVRLSPAQLRGLARDIEAARPVELP